MNISQKLIRIFLIPLLIFSFIGRVYPAAQSFGPVFMPIDRQQTADTGFILDADGEKFAFISQVPKDGNIDKVHIHLGGVTTGDTLKLSLQDVDLADGDPDEVVDQSDTNIIGDGDDGTFQEFDLSSDRAVTKGDFVAVVIEFDSYVAGALIINATSTVSPVANEYPDHKTGSTWAKQGRGLHFLFEYDDGSFASVPYGLFATYSSSTYNSGSDPDEQGIKMKFPVPVTITGFIFETRFSGDFDAVLYDSDGSSVLETKSMDNSVTRSTTLPAIVIFVNEHALTKDTFYRLIVKPGASSVRLNLMTFEAAGWLDGMTGGQNIHFTARTNGGAWTDTTTKRAMLWPLLSKFDDGAGGGASEHSYGCVN